MAVTVVAFIIMPAATNGYNKASLQGQLVRKQLQKAAEQLRDIFPQAMVNSCLRLDTHSVSLIITAVVASFRKIKNGNFFDLINSIV